jgi:hypothetical protein
MMSVENGPSVSETAVATGDQRGTEGSAAPDPRRGDSGVATRARDAARRAWPAVALYLAMRVVSTVVFAALSAGHGFAQRGLFVFVDSGWYRLIAEHGYDTHIAAFGSPFPFFPLFPGLMRAGHTVTGLSVDTVGVVITWFAAAACAWALFELGRLLRDARTGVILAALWALMPSAVIEGASYADTLAISLSAWALYALLRRWWISAAVLACLAGLTRPTAEAVVATVCLSALIALIGLIKRRERGLWRPLAALVIAPLGMLGFLAYVAYRMGSLSGYLKAQQAWGTGFSNVQFVVHRIHDGMLGTSKGYENYPSLITTAVLLAVPVLLIFLARQRVPWEVLSYSLILAVLVYATIHVYTVVPREFLALFPVLLPIASMLAKAGRRTTLPLLLTLAVAAGWYACFIPINAGGLIP